MIFRLLSMPVILTFGVIFVAQVATAAETVIPAPSPLPMPPAPTFTPLVDPVSPLPDTRFREEPRAQEEPRIERACPANDPDCNRR
jgi:hypothetical protein